MFEFWVFPRKSAQGARLYGHEVYRLEYTAFLADFLQAKRKVTRQNKNSLRPASQPLGARGRALSEAFAPENLVIRPRVERLYCARDAI